MQIGAETARFPGVLRGRTGESRRAYSRGYTEVSNNIMCVCIHLRSWLASMYDQISTIVDQVLGINNKLFVCVVYMCRVYGEEVAEVPLVGTRFARRRQGMCRLLMDEIQKVRTLY